MSAPTFWTDLESRGIIKQKTSESLGAWLAQRIASSEKCYCYCGFDPTADSLHIGSLMPVLGLRRLKRAGLVPIVVVGGATGMIGDPSGKAAERTLQDSESLAANVAGMTAQLETLLEGEAGKDFLLVNNADWIEPITLVDFLRDIGKHFSVNMMVHKESVRARLEDREHGISYTEFSYMLLQAYDFLHLFGTLGCRVQVGGSDQWGNITAGIDLIHHKHHGEEVHGFTFPLITTASGQKFGKSERGNVWLDRAKTHPYFLYKYFFDVADEDVTREVTDESTGVKQTTGLLRYFSFRPLEEIESLEKELVEAPGRRSCQKALARDVTEIVHGKEVALALEGLEPAMHSDDVEAFEKHADTLGLLDPDGIAEEDRQAGLLPVAHQPLASLDGEGASAVDLAVEIGLFGSKGEVRREIKSKNSGFRIAGEPVSDIDFRITRDLLGDRRVLQIRKGKKNKRMVCFH